MLAACLSAYAVPIEYIFTGTIGQGSFTPIQTFAPVQTVVPSVPTVLDGGVLTLSFVGDTSQISSPGQAKVPVGCSSGAPVFCSGGGLAPDGSVIPLLNTVVVTLDGKTIIQDSMQGTFAVINNPNGPLPFIGFQSADGNGPLAFLTGGVTVVEVLPDGTSKEIPLSEYDLAGGISETTLQVLAPSTTFGTPALIELLSGGETLRIDNLDATFQAILQTPPQPVPEPATLGLVGLLFGAAAFSRRWRKRS